MKRFNDTFPHPEEGKFSSRRRILLDSGQMQPKPETPPMHWDDCTLIHFSLLYDNIKSSTNPAEGEKACHCFNVQQHFRPFLPHLV